MTLATTARTLATRFREWFEALIAQPPAAEAWQPDRLEYQFACAAPQAGPDGTAAADKVLVAEEYFHGHLDWYNLDVDPAGEMPAPSEPGDTAEPPPARSIREADDAADAGHLQRHAQHALVGLRGRPDQLRRHPARHHRSRPSCC